MARYAGGGTTTVESCRCIDVLDWHRRGCLRSPRRFSWAWKQDGKRVASINVETERQRVTLKYRSRPYGGDWADAKQQFPVAWTPCRFGGDRPWFICSVYANGTPMAERDLRIISLTENRERMFEFCNPIPAITRDSGRNRSVGGTR